MRKVIVFSAVAICSAVGAGFASGRELAVFFGKSSSPLLASVFLFFLFFLLFFCFASAARFSAKVEKSKVFGFAKILYLSNCFFSLCIMTAGVSDLFQNLSPEFCRVFVLIFCVLNGGVVCFGLGGIKKTGIVLTPLIIFAVAFVAARNASFELCLPNGSEIFDAIRYVAYNSLLLFFPVFSLGKEMSVRQRGFASLLSALPLAVLAFFILCAVKDEKIFSLAMPLLALAEKSGIFAFFAAALLCGMFTSAVSVALPVADFAEKKAGDRVMGVFCLSVCSYAVSLVGFKNLTSFLLPLSALFSFLLFICVLFCVLKKRVDF